MQGIINFWKTATGKIAVLGGGSIVGLLSLCFVCTICSTLFEDSSNKQISSTATRKMVSFATEAPFPEPTPTLKPPPAPEPTKTPVPLADVPESTPTPAPTSTPEINQTPIVTASEKNVNMRSGPGTNYDIVGTLSAGQSLEIVGRNADSSWWQVSAPDGLCWVSADVVIASNVDDTIPVVEAPLPPVQPIPTELPPQPTPTPIPRPPQPAEPPASTGPTFTNDEVDPPWWPCAQGQIKGNRDSMIYHEPGGQYYAKTYEGVECFNTPQEAEAAGYRASKR